MKLEEIEKIIAERDRLKAIVEAKGIDLSLLSPREPNDKEVKYGQSVFEDYLKHQLSERDKEIANLKILVETTIDTKNAEIANLRKRIEELSAEEK